MFDTEFLVFDTKFIIFTRGLVPPAAYLVDLHVRRDTRLPREQVHLLRNIGANVKTEWLTVSDFRRRCVATSQSAALYTVRGADSSRKIDL